VAVIYRVKHVTAYRYTEPVLLAQHLAHLTPRHSTFQICLRTQLKISPLPAEIDENGHDYYGNPITFFGMREPHSSLTVQVTSRVEVKNRTVPDESLARDWPGIQDPLEGLRGDPLLDVADFCHDSPYATATPGIRDYAAQSFRPGRSTLAAVLDFNHRIRADFAYDPAATTVATPLAQVLSERRGVCQDFAHFAIAGLRAMGIPARYVSGYLLTRPPPGKPKLRGSDASHAWLSVFLPEFGWIDIDPTNDCMPNDEHVTLGWGRDFGDVSPLFGVVLGGGEHRLKVGVDVEPVNA
jgi:transglutaminase-like putative cysteine protease